MTVSRPSFPSKLPEGYLEWSVVGRLEYFKQRFVAHPKIVEAKKSLMRMVDSSGPTSIVMVVGPTGAGKTTLRKDMCKSILEKWCQQSHDNKSHIPVAGIALSLSDPSKFNWRNDYSFPALIALYEPLIEHKVSFETQKSVDPATGNMVFRRAKTQWDYHKSLETALLQRQPIAFWVDDAQLLTKVTVNQRFKDQIDAIKGYSEVMERNGISRHITHVLFGTYDMLPLVGGSPELARRTRIIHLGRYRSEIVKDKKDFISTLRWVEDRLPVQKKAELEKHTKYFFEQSLGCIGILKDRLTMALENALNDGSDTLLPKHWEEGEMTQWELDSIETMIRDDEARFDDKKENPSHPAKPEKRTNSRRNNKPGQRNPKRDRVGVK